MQKQRLFWLITFKFVPKLPVFCLGELFEIDFGCYKGNIWLLDFDLQALLLTSGFASIRVPSPIVIHNSMAVQACRHLMFCLCHDTYSRELVPHCKQVFGHNSSCYLSHELFDSWHRYVIAEHESCIVWDDAIRFALFAPGWTPALLGKYSQAILTAITHKLSLNGVIVKSFFRPH